ncbi:hypothetical protein RvY_10523 [Ramazzottius varieornatus]|uniref:Oligopeptide transporter 1 n=1 Tax=Ramazzottius varieornatus TaxID=947166 RepID=A0A1D1VHI3_RAMVA|nr:hypothetical protein RvY_10523 [Ramazzottius varieornatus]
MGHPDPEVETVMGKEASAIEHGPVGHGTTQDGSVNGKTGKGGLETIEFVDPELPTKKYGYPWYIVFILGNEFCERFSYYGMKTVLTLYFLEVLLWSEGTTTLVYHLFSVLCYFTPVFGAMLADGFLGKFNTIFCLSLVYVSGLVLLTLSATPPLGLNVVAGTACGLMLIGFGTGGIKPVVPAYGGDQFREGQEKQREQFFSIFYFAINSGSLISTFVTPILRSEVPCFGDEGCYPLAFGLPAGLLAIAVLAFVAGKPFYRNIPAKQNIIARVFGCCWCAIRNKIATRKTTHHDHWLDYAEDHYPREFLDDVKQLLPVLKLFLPLPMFWALFDQQGSRWTLQATKMDGRITDTFTWKPDQMGIFNPILILALIPFFEGVVFKLLDKFNIPFRALARMFLGMVLAGVAFVIAGIVQIKLDGTIPSPVASFAAEIRTYSTFNCPVLVNYEPDYDLSVDPAFTLPAFGEYDEKKHRTGLAKPGEPNKLPINIVAKDCPLLKNSTFFRKTFSVDMVGTSVNAYILAIDNWEITVKHVDLGEKIKPKEGKARAIFIAPFGFNTVSGGGNMTLINPDVASGKKGHMENIIFDKTQAYFEEKSIVMNSSKVLEPGKYEVWYPNSNASNGIQRIGNERMELPNGGVYVVHLMDSETFDANNKSMGYWKRHDVVPPSSLSMFWQLPQIFVLTVGEVLFSVSGLSFAYSQAPVTMKSVLQAGWLMTVAFGNVIVIIIAGAQLTENQATEFFIFAGLIGAFALLFGFMARMYKYVDAKK